MKKPKYTYSFKFVSLIEPDKEKIGSLIAKNDVDFYKRRSKIFNGILFIEIIDKTIYYETNI